MKEGLKGYTATVRDFADHITTVFTEVRIKPQIEVRSADSGPFAKGCALPALLKGLLYDEDARSASWALMGAPAASELANLQLSVAENGFEARFRDQSAHRLCEALLKIAADGLRRIGDVDENGNDERKYLKPLEDLVERKETLAEAFLRKQPNGQNEEFVALGQERRKFNQKELGM